MMMKHNLIVIKQPHLKGPNSQIGRDSRTKEVPALVF